MKSTGIVRRIDDLGRVVVPKEVRRNLKIKEGSPVEIFVDREGKVILKKYSPVADLSTFAKEYVDTLFDSTGHISVVADQDIVVAVAGGGEREFLDRPVSKVIERAMQQKKTIVLSASEAGEDDSFHFISQVISPIILQGDPIGAVIIGSKTENAKLGELEVKLADTAASFLARQFLE